MSKTVRRKHFKSDHYPVVVIDNCLFELGYFGGLYKVNKQYRKLTVEKYNKIQESKYHSDKRFWGQVPSHFTRTLNKLYRSRMNQRIKMAIINDTLDSLFVDKRYNDARWHWL